MTPKDEEWAVFWCTLLRPVIYGAIERKAVSAFLRSLTKQEVLYPNGVRGKPSLSTLRRKLAGYRAGKLQGLARKGRADRGKPRVHSPAVIARAVALKRDQPYRSHVTINNFLKTEFGLKVPASSLYRHLKAAGATRIKLGICGTKVRRRWTYDYTNALWVGDFEEGPYVLHQGEVVPTHLSVFIDCHSRFCIEGRYYYRQTFDILIDSFLRALATHGAPDGVYVDNAKIYHARALKAACFDLLIRLLHRRARDPPTAGIIEKLIQTIQSQFEHEVRAGDILTLEQLNRGFAAWLAMSYHRTVHSETGQPPAERYRQGLKALRPVDLQAVAIFFMQREKRRVHKDFSDVQVKARFYRVDSRLRGDEVEVRYDPYSAMETVLVYSLRGEYLGTGVLHDRQKGEDGPGTTMLPKAKDNYLQLLVRQHEEELRARAGGIDYRAAVVSRRWPFAAFANALADLLGRKGGITAFSTGEIELLHTLYRQIPALNAAFLRDAVAAAREKTVLSVAFELRRLAQHKE